MDIRAEARLLQGELDALDLAHSGLRAYGDEHEGKIVCVGDEIDVGMEDNYLRGHGTRVQDGVLRATVCGVVERVNKLITVRPLKSRYTAEVGDVVVGCIEELSGKRWKVALKAAQEAVLHLSAVNLPGGVQRRRTWEDELNMRNVYGEGDYICAEVQSIHGDGSVALHTRSSKYGKLKEGQLVRVPTHLIKKRKQNFVKVEEAGVTAVLGCNGYIWVCSPASLPSDGPKDDEDDDLDDPMETSGAVGAAEAGPELFANLCIVANVIRALGALQLPITSESITQGVALARDDSVPLNRIGEKDFMKQLVVYESIRRTQD